MTNILFAESEVQPENLNDKIEKDVSQMCLPLSDVSSEQLTGTLELVGNQVADYLVQLLTSRSVPKDSHEILVIVDAAMRCYPDKVKNNPFALAKESLYSKVLHRCLQAWQVTERTLQQSNRIHSRIEENQA